MVAWIDGGIRRKVSEDFRRLSERWAIFNFSWGKTILPPQERKPGTGVEAAALASCGHRRRRGSLPRCIVRGGRPRLARPGLGLWGFCPRLRACADRLGLRRCRRPAL